MAIKITDECINCGACEPECPNTAIYEAAYEWKYSDGTSLKGDLMNELRRRTELMEVVTETPAAEDSDEDDKELKTESDKRKSILEKIIIESPKDDLKDKQP